MVAAPMAWGESIFASIGCSGDASGSHSIQESGRTVSWPSSRAQSFFFGLMNFENLQQVGKFENRTGGFRKPEEGKARIDVPRHLECLDQRSHARTVNVRNAQHVHDQMRNALLAQQVQDRLADFRRIEKGDLPGKVED